ncbi:MAG: DNA topoisomerase I, partial [Elusimicrobiota bacterium]|nr:DNA topoisomerase I [Elusimicrobiota bacterium]
MAKNLVIVESPAKEKTISKILGNDFTVLSSFGHIRDLPKNKLGIDTDNNFEPTYINIPKAQSVLLALRKR